MRQEVKTRYRREPASRPEPVLQFSGCAVLLFFLCAYGYELFGTLDLIPNTEKTYPGSELLRVLRVTGFPASLLLVLFSFLKVLRRRRWRFCVIGSLAVLGLLAVGEIIAAFNSRIGFGCVDMEYVIGSSLMAIGVVIATTYVGKE